MGQYLIDNNVISHYFSNSYPKNGLLFVATVIDDNPIISVITQIEALSWISPNKDKEKIIAEFLLETNILQLNPEIVLECVKIRRSKKIKTPDAIIAATAIVHNLTLITNDDDFEGINNLKIINPMRL